MNSVHDFIDKILSGNVSPWVLGVVGVLLLLIAMKLAKGFMKLIFVVFAVAALAGVVMWYVHKHG
jgi:vacuolar-type H+-ATPase subunit I/STV1